MRDLIAKPVDAGDALVRFANLLETRAVHVELRAVNRELARQTGQFERFVSGPTADLIHRHSGIAIGTGELRSFALLFTDMRNFTGLAGSMAPGQVFRLLADSLQVQMDTVLRCSGHVDKIYGDGLLAYFEGEDMAERALRCALRIRDQVSGVGPSMTPPVGIGVHVGRVLFGFLGTQDRMDHTVVGDTVNTCARICGEARPFQVVTTEDVRAAVGEAPGIRFRALGPVALKGKAQPASLFEAVTAGERTSSTGYHAALSQSVRGENPRGTLRPPAVAAGAV